MTTAFPPSREAVTCTQLNTKISNASGVSVSTIEHLMAALAALDVDNVIVEVDGPEAPDHGRLGGPLRAADGPRRPTHPGDSRAAISRCWRPSRCADGAKRAALLPCDRFEVAFEIAFPSAAIGRQAIDLAITERSFRDQLASARTFGFVHEVDALSRMGLARGGSLDNAIAHRRRRDAERRSRCASATSSCGTRRLDAIGDLYVMGAPVVGRFETRYGGHALNNVLVRALMADPTAWRDAHLRAGTGRGGLITEPCGSPRPWRFDAAHALDCDQARGAGRAVAALRTLVQKA